MAPNAVKLRDTYKRIPYVPFYHKTVGLWMCEEAWYEIGLAHDTNLNELFMFNEPGYQALEQLGWCEAAFAPVFEESVLEDRGDHELVPRFEVFKLGEQDLGDWRLAVIRASRTPVMMINVDWAGTQQFCLDVAMEIPELFELYEARKKLFLKETELIAKGLGQFVKWLENLTISMLGPQRYGDLLVSVYNKAVPILDKAGKRVMVHYDGALSVIADQIVAAPFHMIESLTEPPEGNMMYDKCRAAWPLKSRKIYPRIGAKRCQWYSRHSRN